MDFLGGGLAIQIPDNPPIPYATLRAHPFSVTSIEFLTGSTQKFLISGDEGGWCFVWNIHTRRPIFIWRPHSKSIISVKFLPAEHQPVSGFLVLTHGRDNKLNIFHIIQDANSESTGNVSLPLQSDVGDAWPSPTLVYSQDVNTLNFCSAAFSVTTHRDIKTKNRYLTFAVPSTLASENVDVYQVDRDNSNKLTRLASAIESPISPMQPIIPDSETNRNAGIVMALLMAELPGSPSEYLLVVGYESGLVAVFKIFTTSSEPPTLLYASKCHSQPILSLDLDTIDFSWFISSSADAKIVKHPLSDLTETSKEVLDPWGVLPLITFNSKHSGLASLDIRSDSKIFATAGWDGMIRVFSATGSKKNQKFKSLAVFKGGRQNGVTTVAFSPISTTSSTTPTPTSLSAKLQQRKMRNDTHLLAAGGKDGRISLYSLY